MPAEYDVSVLCDSRGQHLDRNRYRIATMAARSFACVLPRQPGGCPQEQNLAAAALRGAGRVALDAEAEEARLTKRQWHSWDATALLKHFSQEEFKRESL